MFIKKIAPVLTAAVMVCSMIPAYTVTAVDAADVIEYTAAENDTFKYNIYSDHIELNGIKKGDDPVVIPSEIDGLPVTDWNYKTALSSVKSRGLSIDKSNTSFTIEDDSLICKTSMTLIGYIGDYRKDNSTYTIPDGIKIVANGAFHNDLWLEHINIPDSVEVISNSAFSITMIDEFHISKNVRELSETAFTTFNLSNIDIDPENPYFDTVNGAIMNEAHSELILIPSYVKVDEFVIPEGTVSIRSNAFLNARNIRDLVIPSTYVGDYHLIQDMDGLENVYVSEKNPDYSDIDGVLFSKDKKTLLKYPDHKNFKGTYVVPDGTVKIGPLAFYYSDLRDLTFPASVSEMELYSIYTTYHYQGVMTFLNPKVNLSRCLTYFTQSYNHDTGETTHLVTVRGYKNSTAESFARDNQANFEVIDGEPPKVTTTTSAATTTTSSTTSKTTTTTSATTSKTTSSTTSKTTSSTTSKTTSSTTSKTSSSTTSNITSSTASKTTTVSTTTTAPAIAGDLNNDKSVNVADLVILSNYLHGKKVNITNADLNNDGIIDSLDMCRLRKLVLSYNK